MTFGQTAVWPMIHIPAMTNTATVTAIQKVFFLIRIMPYLRQASISWFTVMIILLPSAIVYPLTRMNAISA